MDRGLRVMYRFDPLSGHIGDSVIRIIKACQDVIMATASVPIRTQTCQLPDPTIPLSDCGLNNSTIEAIQMGVDP